MTRTVLITGANRGIGFQAAKELADQGHRVILTARNQEKLKKALEQINGDVLGFQLDVTDSSSIDTLTGDLGKQGIKLNAVIHNAGSVFDKMGASAENQFFQTSRSALRETFELNVFGVYNLNRALFEFLDQSERIDIIHVSSGMGSLTDMGGGAAAYRMSKAALNAMTLWLTAETKGRNIHINSVCPGWVKTDLGGPNATRELPEGVIGIKWLINQTPEIKGKFIRDRNLIDF